MERYPIERCRLDVPRPLFIRHDAEAEQLTVLPEMQALFDNCSAAMEQLPEGKIGLVIGAGGNVTKWREAGWQTLDIQANVAADITGDANWLEHHIPPASLDYLVAECVSMSPCGEDNLVGQARLLQQANLALKPGGKLIIITAHIAGEPNTLPQPRRYAYLMNNHGFQAVVRLGKIFQTGPRVAGQYLGKPATDKVVLERSATYYGVKVADGFETE